MNKDFAGGYLFGICVGALLVGLCMLTLYNQDLKQANRILQKELSAGRSFRQEESQKS